MYSSYKASMPSIIKVICILSLFSLMLCQSETIINSATGIKVCFTGKHTWVSDLRFYLIGPSSCNSPNIQLYKPPQIGSCNSGDDFNNLCFSTSTGQSFNACEAQTPLTGTYGSANGVPIDWSGLYGCNSATTGWKLQIYDCISLEVGKLTGGTLQFKLNEQTILYESGAINSPINDNSCSANTASVFEVQVNCAIEFCTACANSMAGNEVCYTCNDDANGNARVPSIDRSACVLDCSLTQDCKECVANPSIVCTSCGQDANGNAQVPSIDGSACLLDCSVIQDCIECTANPNAVCTTCTQDSFGNPQVPSPDGSSCVSPCKIRNCIACEFYGTKYEKCSQCSSVQNGNLLVPAPSGKICIKDRSAKQCHQSCQRCVGTWNFCSRCKPGLKWVRGGTCINQ